MQVGLASDVFKQVIATLHVTLLTTFVSRARFIFIFYKNFYERLKVNRI